jgi:hypothetical protein
MLGGRRGRGGLRAEHREGNRQKQRQRFRVSKVHSERDRERGRAEVMGSIPTHDQTIIKKHRNKI